MKLPERLLVLSEARSNIVFQARRCSCKVGRLDTRKVVSYNKGRTDGISTAR